MTEPFTYPATERQRRHGPRGYELPASFQPWLRDEFEFRCVYCMKREVWQEGDHEVDHFEASSLAPERRLDYDNLLYACRTCNGVKKSRRIPDPCHALVRDAVRLEADGTLTPLTRAAKEIVQALALNVKRHREFRVMWMQIVEVVRANDPRLYRYLMGYPKRLPNLHRLRPPGGNAKPEGLETSYHARRTRGELPETY